MALIKSDAAIAATPANQSPVDPPKPQQAVEPSPFPPKDAQFIRQNVALAVCSSQIVAALAVTAVTEKEQMELVKRWMVMVEEFIMRPFPDSDVPF